MNTTTIRQKPATGAAANVVLFGDDDVAAHTAERPSSLFIPRNAPLGQIAQQLNDTKEGSERRALMRNILRRAGFDWLCYCRILRIGQRVVELAWFDTYSPPGWAARYCSESLFAVDPRVDVACRVEWPFLWDVDSLASLAPAPSRTARIQPLTDAANAAGMRSGVCIGIGTTNPLERCFAILSSSQAGRSWIADTTAGTAYAIAIGLHAWVDPYASQLLSRISVDGLSVVQRSILQCVTEGMSDREIAASVGMQPHRVAQHVRQLLSFFRAHNRVQLAYIAGTVSEYESAR
ncbi:autoinducer binding domain-containing protein [Trinickia sp. LjRoot230]|uniref:helix-turn-helix transcriptional regulator n=1 Tax=Trinickia sp. LjRoot230 TaxID=3342288 RepID=UPI003ECE3100